MAHGIVPTAAPLAPSPALGLSGRFRRLRDRDRAAWLDRAAWTLLLATFLIALLTFRHYGVTWDEPGLRQYGRLLVDWYASGFSDARAFSFANLRYYGGAFDITATLIEPLTPLGAYELRHLMGGLIGLLGLVLVWRLGRRLGGGRAGLLACLILAALPGWWGHMFFNSKDIPFAVGMIAAIAVWCRILAEWPQPRRSSALLLGLALGLTFGIRIGGIILFAYGAAPLLIWLLLEARERGPLPALRDLAAGLLALWPALPVAVPVLVLAWPWVALAPGNLLEAVGYLSHFPYDADTVFAGTRYPAEAVPACYWPTLLGLQLTEIMLAGLICAAWAGRSACAADQGRRLGLVTLWVAALLPVAYAVLARPTAYNNVRHFIFVLPPLAVLAGLGLDRLLRRLRGAARAVAVLLVALGLALPAWRIVQLHPYEYVYFNDLSGGVAAARDRFELDYWGTSLGELGRQVAGRLAQQQPAGFGLSPVPIRVCGPFETAQEVLPPGLLPVYHNAPARLALALAIFFCVEPPPGSEVASVERMGVVLSRAYVTPPERKITSFTEH
ncbi:MAG: glycosyltransferase family 39 protein [Geminicoccaceae bacterium]